MKIGSKVIAVLTIALMLFGNIVITPSASACNEWDAGYIKIHKVDADTGANLAGAKFKIQKKDNGSWRDFDQKTDGSSSPTMTTGSDGYARSGLMYEGVYRVIETDAPAGYELDTTPSGEITVTRAMFGKDTLLCGNLTNKKCKANIRITKDDGHEKMLKGAKFKLYKFVGSDWVEQEGTYTSDEHGVCSINNLPLGKYKVEEIEAPKGYENSSANSIENVLDEKGETVTYAFQNCQKPLGSININKKVTKLEDGESIPSFKVKIAGPSDNANVASTTKEYTIGAGNNEIKDLAYGTYTIEEVDIPNGYDTNYTISARSFTINDEHRNNITIDIVNTKLYGSAKFYKAVDGIDGDTTQFTLRIKKNGTFYANVTVSEAGPAAELKNMPFGDYTVEEINIDSRYAPAGISPNSFTIGYKNYSAAVEVTATNTLKKGKVQFIKDVNNVDDDPTTFTLTVKREDGSVYNTAVVSEKNSVTWDSLPLGTYTVEETGIPAGYEAVDLLINGTRTNTFTVTGDNFANTVSVKAVNRKQLGSVKFVKDVENADNDATEFTLTVKNADGSFNKTVKVSEKNSVTWNNLPLGTYTVEETGVPAGYEKVGLTVKGSTTNTFTVTSANYATEVLVTAVNKKQLAKVVFSKAVENASDDSTDFTLTIYKDGSKYDTVTVNAKSAKTLYLPLGSYTVEETGIPAGYEKVKLEVNGIVGNAFTVTADNYTNNIAVKATNKKQFGSVSVKKEITNETNTSAQFTIRITGAGYENNIVVTTAGVVSSTQPLDKLPLGNYKVQELSAPGYNQVSLSPQEFSITAANYATAISIVAKNEKQLGKVKLIKDVDNVDNDPTKFTFNIKQGDTVVKKIDNVTEAAYVEFELPLGTYTVEEVAVPGYSLVGEISPNPITLTAENYTKVIEVKAVNHKLFGSVMIEKDVDNVTDDPKEFSINLIKDGSTVKTVKVVDGKTATVDGLPLGAYKVEEVSDPSYSNISIIPNTFNITVENYNKAEINIKVINSIHEGKVTVKKDVANVANDPTEFTVRITGSGTAAGYASDVKVNEAGVISSSMPLDKLPLGHYKAEEINVNAGYIKNGISIQIGTDPVITTGEFDLTAANYTAAITVTAVNTQKQGSAQFLKVVEGETVDATVFTLKLQKDGAAWRDVKVSEAGGLVTLNDLPFGTYAVSELLSGSAYLNTGLEVTVNGAKQAKPEFTIDDTTLNAVIKVTATNKRQNNAITLKKTVSNASGDTTRFTINISNGAGYNNNFEISDADGIVNSSKNTLLADLPFGTYTVTETGDYAGYDKIGIKVDSADKNTFVIDENSYGKTIAIVATNSKRFGKVSLEKAVDNAEADATKFSVRIWNDKGYDHTVTLSQTDGLVDGGDYSFLNNLPYGTYNVSEAATGTEYEQVGITIDGKSDSTFTVGDASYSAAIAIKVINHRRMGSAEFSKVVDNWDNDPTEFTLNVLDKDRKIVGTVKVNETGAAQKLGNLPFGTYTVEEVAVTGYETKSIEPASFTINDKTFATPVKVTATNHRKLGSASFSKAFDNIEASEDPTVFTLTVTGDNGYYGEVNVGYGITGASLWNLPFGHYTVDEKPTAGYDKVSITPSTFEINESNYLTKPGMTSVSVAAVNHKHMGKIQVLKQDSANPSIYLAFAEFQISTSNTDFDANVVDTLLTDASGQAVSKDLPLGTYWVRETRAPGGYVIDNAAAIEVTLPTDKALKILTFKDTKDVGSLIIRKLSTLDDSPVQDVQFQVSTRSDFAEASLFKLPNLGKTDAKGELVLQNLESGITLYVREIKQAAGYDIDVTAVKNVTVVFNKASTVVFRNNPVGKVQLTKVAADDATVKLPGAVFGIYSDATCTKLVETLAATDANGLAISGELPFAAGTIYYVKEITAPSGYLLNTEIKQVKFTKPGEIVALTFADPKAAASLIILKQDALDAAKKLAGATFQLYSDAGLTTKVGAPVITGTDGLARWSNLAAGTYWVVETAAPKDYELLAVAIQVTVTAGVTSPEPIVIKNQYNPPQDIQTGMMDWNILLIGGAVLLAGIAILLITRRRQASKHAKK